MHGVSGVSGVGAVVDVAWLVLEGLVLFRVELKASGLGTVVGLLSVLMPACSLIASALMTGPRLAGRAAGGPRRAPMEVLLPIVAQGRLEHLALLGFMTSSATNPADRRGRKDRGGILASLARSQLLGIDEPLTKATDLGEVEGDLGRGDVLGQCVNFVLETIPL